MRYYFYFLDLLPYFIIAVLLIICLLSKSLKENVKSKIVFISLMLFSVLRYDVGWDYYMYKYQIITGDTGRYELLSKFVFDLGRDISFYPIVFIFFGFFTLYYTKLTIDRYSKNVVLSWIIFYGLPFLFMASLSTIRQSLATAIIFYSVNFALKKQYYKFIFFILTAYFFHSSAVIGLLLYPLVHYKIRKSTLFVLLISSLLLDNFFGDYLKNIIYDTINGSSNLTFYIDNPNEEYQMIKLKILLNIICLVSLAFYNKIIFKSDLSEKFLTISTFGVIFFNSFIFEPNSAYRIGAFFMQFWVLLIPDYIFKFRERSKVREILIASFFIFFNSVMLWLLIIAYLNEELEKIGVLPYDFWFNNLN